MNETKNPNELFSALIEKMRAYHPSSDFDLVEKAYNLAKQAHEGQTRRSGEPYIIHPLEVADILADLELDRETIAAGILHDIIEDTDYSYDDIAEIFGEEVANLVDGVTKLQKIKVVSEFRINPDKEGVKNRDHRRMSREEEQAENYRKLFLAMANDIRVVLIKIADRIHNLRTLRFMPPEKQKRIAQESLDIYAPLAGRLGISTLRRELEDISFKFSDPDSFAYMKQKVDKKVDARNQHIEDIVITLDMLLKERRISGKVKGRAKNFFSIHRKIKQRNVPLEEILDLFAVRIIVDTVADCWAVLSLVHEIFPPMPGKFKNYISNPKPNGYQSIHDVLIGPDGEPFELQIRTVDMHRLAESGIAAHWKYKEGKRGAIAGEEKIAWLAQILELQRENKDNEEFMPLLKGELDIYAGYVHCYTPEGHVKVLAHGSNCIDFAYAIHSAVGNRMVGAKVFGRIVPKDYVLKDGDRVEIMTSANSRGPTAEWLKIVKTSQAKNKIRQWLKQEDREQSIVKGKELLDAAAAEKDKGLTLAKIRTPEGEKIVLTRYSMHDFDTLCASIGRGAISERSVLNRLYEEYLAQNPEPALDPQAIIEEINKNARPQREITHKGDVIVQGAGDLAIFYSKCCSPVPGDEIIGFTTRGRGVAIHRANCLNILNLPQTDTPRLINAEWNLQDAANRFAVDLKIYCDAMNVITQVTDLFQRMAVEIKALDAKNMGGEAIFTAAIAVANRDDLEKVASRLLSLKGVHEVDRIMA
ncbi:MAG: bifunctional (p)ppGpp synthetase/guanosine-3',5'-bis(diphosphate) 3'-pyrophosphohydrolase [Clostridiales bacterium]|nr:bifunctional (p)ppGpp synthetase/guanosine-3',5'-bis(diphosphate) 3'-pyrophosphohydrolase [Clostridiales bacterium]